MHAPINLISVDLGQRQAIIAISANLLSKNKPQWKFKKNTMILI